MWWRDPTSWRVSTLRTTGETDLVHRGDRMLRWVYESKNADARTRRRSAAADTADLLPNELARRALSGARSGEVARLPARRIAGRDALGLRLRPADPQAAIARVDVWADRPPACPCRCGFRRGGRSPR